MTSVPTGLLMAVTGHRPRERDAVLGGDEARVEQRREPDGGELEGPVVDDEASRPADGRADAHRLATAVAVPVPSSSAAGDSAGWPTGIGVGGVLDVGCRRGPTWARRRRRAPASCGCGTGRASGRGSWGRDGGPCRAGRRAPRAGADRARSSWASDGTRTIRARSTTLIWPLSSDTTTATASVSSVMPSAARCRVPNRSDRLISVSGRSAAAARIRPSRMMTAPSWSDGPRREDRAQELAREVGVDHDAGLGDLLEAGVALEHDQGAVALARQHARGLGDLGGDVLDGALRRSGRAASRRSRRARCARGRVGARAGRRRRARTGRRPRPPAGSG